MIPNGRMTHPIQIIQGGQYGSEAKGAVAAHFAQVDNIDAAVRTGATNAGHTVVHNGIAVKMQQLPVGWVNPNTKLIIGAGAIIDMAILRREISEINALTGKDVRSRLFIDYRAGVHHPEHAMASTMANRHHLIGATGKGCSDALMSKIRNRGVRPGTIKELPEAQDLPLTDTCAVINNLWDRGAKIQLEGTQGTLLDLHLGPYPYTTHKQTGPAQWMMEAGLSPALPTDIIMVVRTHPIRVAGNSGPLPLETSWLDLAKHINDKLSPGEPLVPAVHLETFRLAIMACAADFEMPATDPFGLDMHRWTSGMRLKHKEACSELHANALALLEPEVRASLSRLFEFTTVTRKLRRIANLSPTDLRMAAMQVRPNRAVVTFMNYEFPQLWHSTAPVTPDEFDYCSRISTIINAPVTHINRGPESKHIIRVQ